MTTSKLDYSSKNIGLTTLKDIKDNVTEDTELIDLSNTIVHKEVVLELSSIIFENQLQYLAKKDLKDKIELYINSGQALRFLLGDSAYGQWVLKLISESDYPLMIKDNCFLTDLTSKYELVQPVSLESNLLKIKVLKPKFVEPINLELALENNEDVWKVTSVNLMDIGRYDSNIRFANTLEERTLIDIYENVLNRNLSVRR